MTILVHSKLSNGASVADWLGTAATAARSAANRMEDVRQQRAPNGEHDLKVAREFLEQAIEELNCVENHLAYVTKWGERR